MNEHSKKKMTVIAILILAVVITSAIIGTLAKYSTSETISDDASVATFGLNIPHSINLFSDSYTNVKADTDGKKVIAPGTSGEYEFTVSGTSEVTYKVNADIAVVYSEEWGDYKPLEFSIDGNTWTSFEEFETNLSNALASDVIQPNTEYNSKQTLHWRWPYHITETADVADTEVGSKAAIGTAPKVTVNLEVIASQLD